MDFTAIFFRVKVGLILLPRYCHGPSKALDFHFVNRLKTAKTMVFRSILVKISWSCGRNQHNADAYFLSYSSTRIDSYFFIQIHEVFYHGTLQSYLNSKSERLPRGGYLGISQPCESMVIIKPPWFTLAIDSCLGIEQYMVAHYVPGYAVDGPWNL